MAARDISASEEDPSSRRSRWRVLKFGGTSVASAERWDSIERIVRRRTHAGSSVLIVCSAVAGVTDLLTELVRALRRGAPTAPILEAVRDRHVELGREIGVAADDLLARDFHALEQLAAGNEHGPAAEASIMAHGELMSTRLGAARLTLGGTPCAWVDARQLLEADAAAGGSPEDFLSATCSPAPSARARACVHAENTPVVITQGFIARSPAGDTVLLGRGGSDTSAAYLACLLSADRLEIWTDVPGLFTANPRRVPEARLLRRVGYREAQTLGALGAKALHPRAIEAVWEHGIPIEIGWTAQPDIEGTCINASRAGNGVKAITSRRRLAMFALRRPPSWQPVGFLADVAVCFAARGLSMDLVSSSCSEIRVTVDLEAFPSAEAQIPELIEELGKSCQARVVHPVASVSVVGEAVSQSLLGSESGFGLFADEALFMVVHAANEHHVSFVLDESAALHLVRTAHEELIVSNPDVHDLGPSWASLNTEEGA